MQQEKYRISIKGKRKHKKIRCAEKHRSRKTHRTVLRSTGKLRNGVRKRENQYNDNDYRLKLKKKRKIRLVFDFSLFLFIKR